MADREEVIKGLENLSEWLFQQYRVVYDGDTPNYYDAYKTIDDAIALLKEQNDCENCAIAIEDRQPIVRCKDCLHRSENHRCYADNPMRGQYVGNDWFCADGKDGKMTCEN